MDRKRLAQIVTAAIEEPGFEVVRLHNHPPHVVRVWVDRDPGGPGIEDCRQLMRAIRNAIEEEGDDPGDYQVEVQSPGLDRPLVRAKDYERFAGQQVQVTLKEKVEGRRNFKGALIGLQEGEVVVQGPDGAEPWRWSQRDVKETRLVPDLPFAAAKTGPEPERKRKPRKSRRKRPKQH